MAFMNCSYDADLRILLVRNSTCILYMYMFHKLNRSIIALFDRPKLHLQQLGMLMYTKVLIYIQDFVILI